MNSQDNSPPPDILNRPVDIEKSLRDSIRRIESARNCDDLSEVENTVRMDIVYVQDYETRAPNGFQELCEELGEKFEEKRLQFGCTSPNVMNPIGPLAKIPDDREISL